MKKIIYSLAAVLVLAILSLSLQSCEQYNEMPDQSETSYTRYYKVADPSVLSSEERAEVDAIRAEYEEAVN